MRYQQSILSVLGVIFVCALGPFFGARAAGAAVSSQELHSYSIVIEFDKDGYYAGETVYFDVQLIKDQEPVALDALEIEAVLRQEEKILPLTEHGNSRGTFSGILNEENSAVEVTVYRKNRQERTEVLLARKEKFLKDIERLRNSRWFLFWKREEVDGEIDQLGRIVEKIESAVEQLNAPLAKRSQSILVLHNPKDDGEEKEGQWTIAPHDDGTPEEEISSYPGEDPAEISAPKTGGSYDLAGEPSKKTKKMSSRKTSSPEQPKSVETSSPKGLVPTLTKGQKKSLPKEKISEDVVSEVPKAASPSTAHIYITPLYSRARDTIPPVTSPDSKKDGTVTSENARIAPRATDNVAGAEIVLDSPADGRMIEESTITIKGTVSSDTVEVCGDGVVQAKLNEECDDGNAANGDGCGRNCLREQIVDTTPPSIPSGLSCGSVSTSQTNLSWSASVDNVGVTGYKVYRDGILVISRQSPVVSYSDLNLTANTTYSYTVSAYDAAGNESGNSIVVSATTQAPAPVLGDVDGDNDVDGDDLAVVVANLGKVSGFDARADVNKDDKVDIFDLMLTAKHLINERRV